MANLQIFEEAVEAGRRAREERRARKDALEDEQRQFQVQDLFAQRNAIRDRISKLGADHPDYQKGMQSLSDIQQNLAQIYHPVKAPGALQRDWQFLRGLIGRRFKKPEAAPPVAAGTTPDLTIRLGDQSIAYPAALGETVSTAAVSPLPSATLEGMKTATAPAPTPAPAPMMPQGAAPAPAAGAAAPAPATFAGIRRAAAPAAEPGGPVTLPQQGQITVPGTPLPAVAYQKRTPYEAKLAAQREQAVKEAERFMQGAPQTPKEEAEAEIQKKIAGIEATMAALKNLPGLDMSDDELAEVKKQFLETTLGITGKEKFYSQLQTTVDTSGKTHVWRIPQKEGAMPEEIAFPEGQTFAGKAGAPADGTKGTDFMKYVRLKYGEHYTPENVEEARRYWVMLGAHGTARTSVTDAAGNTSSTSVPVFSSPVSPTVAAKLGGAAFTGGGEAPAYGGGTLSLGGGATGAGGGITLGPAGPPAAGATPGAVNLETTPAMAQVSPEQRNAALAEADRLRIGQWVRGIASYQINPSQVKGRGGQVGKVWDLVMKVNPAYDGSKWQAVQEARTSFLAGNDADNFRSLGTAINHLNKLQNAYDELGNTFNPTINSLKNKATVQMGSGAPQEFITTAAGLADEVGRVFRQSGLTQTEVETWKSNIDPNMSPEAFKKSVQTLYDLIAGRLVNSAQKYRNVFGTLQGMPQISQEAQEILGGQRLRVSGAQQILDIFREARGEAPPQRRTAPAPAGPAPQAKGTVSMADARRKYPGVSDEVLRLSIMQQGLVPVN